MQIAEVLQELERAGTARNREVYARHGIGRGMFGVSFATLRALAARIRTDHALATALWGSGNHDARVLATMVADPAAATAAEIERWARDLDNYVLTDAFSDFVAKTPHAASLVEKWMSSKDEWVGRAGWRLVALLAMEALDLPDAWFEARLAAIEREIHRSANRVRDAMNGALIAIGVRNDALAPRALAAAQHVGKVEVDHGETGCKTPDAAEYIQRTLAYRHGAKAKPPRAARTPRTSGDGGERRSRD
jgi:3-methyladenine DNA glycosylase AlkD